MPTKLKLWLRLSVFILPPFLVTLWTTIPALQPAKQVVQGSVSKGEACLIICSPVISLGEKKIACHADVLGVSYACGSKSTTAGDAKITYAAMPSLARLIGLQRTDGVLLKLERDGKVLYSRSISDHAWSALYGGWVFHAIYWPLMGLVIWWWPNSRLSRRATWQDVSEEGAAQPKAGSGNKAP